MKNLTSLTHASLFAAIAAHEIDAKSHSAHVFIMTSWSVL